MLLMSDGSVFVHKDDSGRWERLVPNRYGNYVKGTWHQGASLPAGYRPQYFASALLPSGRLIILGGEYDGGAAQVETNRGAIYDPAADAWRRLSAPPGWSQVGDAQSTVLDDGRFLIADVNGSGDALLNPRTLSWTSTGAGKLDLNDEEGFSLLPDGRVLTVDTDDQASELYNPATGTWSSAGTVPVNLVDPNSEQGPLVGGPDGTVFAIGATGRTAIYHSGPGAPGRWSVGPNLPRLGGHQMVAADAAAARLPDGQVLLDVSPTNYKAPTHFFLFDGHRLVAVQDNDTASLVSAYDTRMLVLPTGQILYDDDEAVYVFKAPGAPHGDWRPRISAVRRRLGAGWTYRLAGLQLAGRDQGAAYGDDFQDDTNYPLVRIVNLSSKVVTYARTLNWSSVSTAPGTRSATSFRVPPQTPPGRSSLVVVANGIASQPLAVSITRPTR